MSPTAKPLAFAVDSSIAISRGPDGQAPRTSVSGLKRWSAPGSTLIAFGVPLIVLPFLSISLASPSTEPEAAATSGSVRTFASSEAGKPGELESPASEAKALLPLIVTSVCL